MSETKEFPLCDVISAATDYLVSERGIGAVYDVLNFATGESLFTHQLPRVGKEFGAHLLRVRPDLQPIFDEAKDVNPSNWRHFASDWEDRFGRTITIGKMSEDDHERIDALSELAEKVHPDNIIVVEP